VNPSEAARRSDYLFLEKMKAAMPKNPNRRNASQARPLAEIDSERERPCAPQSRL
jgi:hypothetical protein